jgi:hypothetical protein
MLSCCAVQPRSPPQTVLPSTVRQVDSVDIPDYGTFAAWGATTQQGGLCLALRAVTTPMPLAMVATVATSKYQTPPAGSSSPTHLRQAAAGLQLGPHQRMSDE